MSPSELILNEVWTQRLGWMLIHSAWQAAALAMLLAALLRLLEKRSARVRYSAGCVVLLAMLCAPVATVWLTQPATPPVTAVGMLFDGASGREVAGNAMAQAPQARGESEPAGATPQTEVSLAVAGEGVLWQVRYDRAMAAALPWLVALWLAGVAGVSLWHAGGWLAMRRLVRRSVALDDARLRLWFGQIVDRMGIRAPVRLVQSPAAAVPMVFGWLRPVVLLPISAVTGMDGDQLRCLLAHELAHVRRLDYLVNLFQVLVETLMFYHPAVWWACRQVRIEREHCCDDLAVSVGGRPATYARALVAAARLARCPRQLAMAADGGSLTERVFRVLDLPGRRRERLGWTGGAALAAAVMVLTIVVAGSSGVEKGPWHDDEIAARVFDVPRVTGIVIDGRAEDWADNGFRIEGMVQTRGPDLYSPSREEGDFATKARLGWDERGMLVLVRVWDNQPIEDPRLDQLWTQDCVEMFLGTRRGTKDYWQVIFAPGVDGLSTRLRSCVYDRRADESLRRVRVHVDAARTVVAGGYLLEVLLPWDVLGIEPGVGTEAAFQLYVQDHDGQADMTQVVWYPMHQSSGNSWQMYTVRLAGTPSRPWSDERRIDTAAWQPGLADKHVDFRVVDRQTGEPVVGAAIQTRVGENQYYTRTDADGRAKLALFEDDPPVFYAKTTHPDYVGIWRWWRGHQPAEDIPAEYTLELEPAATVGGVVVDEQGRPVSGARVDCWTGRQNGDSRPNYYPYTAGVVALTDEQGRWQRGALRGEFDIAGVTVAHPAYRHATMQANDERLNELRAGTLQTELSSGRTVVGTVVDNQGHSIGGARVLCNGTETQADEAGRFRFANLPDAGVVFEATAPGFGAITVAESRVRTDTGDVLLEMPPALVLRGRVVDEKGNGILGVYLTSHSSHGWQGQTDADGRFEWIDAPREPMHFSIWRLGLTRQVIDQVLQAGDGEYVITITRSGQFGGMEKTAP